ncbi:MAG: RHS repeat-associated core domain-containing protein [Fimbriimonadaceae bacterium]
MSARVSNIGGRIVGVKRNGVYHSHQHDALGNTIALINDAGVVTDTYAYWPYGELRTSTGSTTNPFKFCGAWGYYTDTTGRTYVRARTLRPGLTRWMTVDPLWPNQPRYVYCLATPTLRFDYFGLAPEETPPPYSEIVPGVPLDICTQYRLASIPLGAFLRVNISVQVCRTCYTCNCPPPGLDFATQCLSITAIVSVQVGIRLNFLDGWRDLPRAWQFLIESVILPSAGSYWAIGCRNEYGCPEKGTRYDGTYFCVSGCLVAFSATCCTGRDPACRTSLGYCGLPSVSLSARFKFLKCW